MKQSHDLLAQQKVYLFVTQADCNRIDLTTKNVCTA